MWSRFISLAAVALLSLTAPATAKNPAPVFRVGLAISSKDDSLRNLIQSDVSRELRALHDVEPVNDYNVISAVIADSQKRPIQYALEVVALKNASVIAVSVAFVRRYNNLPAQNFVESLGKDNFLKYLHTYIDNQQEDILPSGEIFITSELYTVGNESQIENVCQEIVADFDTQILTPRRKNLQEAKAQAKGSQTTALAH